MPYTKTYTFSNGTTADGGQVDTEVTNLGTAVNALYTALVEFGTSQAVNWADFSSSIALKKADGTTALTGTVRYARYSRVGKNVTFAFIITDIGNPSGDKIYLNLPVAPRTIATYNIMVGTGASINGDVGTLKNGAAFVTNSFPTLMYQTYDTAGSNFGSGSNIMYNTIVYEAST